MGCSAGCLTSFAVHVICIATNTATQFKFCSELSRSTFHSIVWIGLLCNSEYGVNLLRLFLVSMKLSIVVVTSYEIRECECYLFTSPFKSEKKKRKLFHKSLFSCKNNNIFNLLILICNLCCRAIPNLWNHFSFRFPIYIIIIIINLNYAPRT